MSANQIAAFRKAHDPFLHPPPAPLPLLSRVAVLTAQDELLERERALDRRGDQRTRRVVVGPGKAWSSKKVEELEAVELGEEGGLRTDERSEGKVVVVRIISGVIRTAPVNFVVEDRAGRVAPVQVYSLPARCSHEELQAIYPLGSCWAIKEPVVRSSSKGYLIRIDAATDLVRLLPSHTILSTHPFTNPLPSAAAPHRSTLEHKNSGNKFFTGGQSLAALEEYTLALDQLAQLLVDGAADADTTLHAVLLSNRAACHLKLGRPTPALADAQAALSFPALADSLRVKLLYRAGCAQYALEAYDACEDTLERLFKLAKEDPTALELYWRLSRRVHERDTGAYDWEGLYELSRSNPTLDIASYRHPGLEARDAPGKHRGLFCTQTLDPGELLFVQKPLAVGRKDETRGGYVMGVNLWTDSLDPYAMGDVVSALVERWRDEPERRAEIGSLWAGEELGFLSGAGGDDVDISRLEAIATFNSFHLAPLTEQESPATSPQQEDYTHVGCALYGLPSYMNHACMGNVSYSFLGDVIFARARVRIEPGTELVDSYVNALDDLDTRRENLKKHGFVCECDLCKLDELDGAERRARRTVLAEEIDALTERIHSDGEEAGEHLPRLRALLHQLDAAHAHTRPPLRPATYPAHRLLAQSLADGGKHEEAMRVELDALRALGAVFATPAGEELGALEQLELRQVPKVGDANAVLSCLFIAQQWGELDSEEGERHWVHVARRIERGQSGERLFGPRYWAWAERHYLDLTM